MLEPKRLRENPEDIRKTLINRGTDTQLLDAFSEIDKKWREKSQEVDGLKHQQHQISPKGKPSPEQLQQLKELSEKIKSLNEEVTQLEARQRQAALLIPNVPLSSVPIGQNDNDNKLIKQWQKPKEFPFSPKPHHELGVELGILDFEGAVQLAGARFTVYKGAGAKLERALINFMLDTHSESHGYTEILPPVIVNSDCLTGTGQLPKFGEDIFKLENSDFWLSPTAEVQLTNLFGKKILNENELPQSLCAWTSCFRKEAGSYGKDMAGVIRQHQFNKVELVKVVHPKTSPQELENLTSHAERILELLNLPYRRMELCTGDLGFSSAKTYDLEVWMPSQNTYREISSCSNFLDFQTRRAMIRYKDIETDKVLYPHTLNGSGLAVGRTVAAILENYQNDDGSINVPDVLQNYIKTDKIK